LRRDRHKARAPWGPTTKSTGKITNTVSSLRMLMVVLFDGANISLVVYRVMVPKADRSAHHFDTKILFEHVMEESESERSNHCG
jgi:hypothetical protein